MTTELKDCPFCGSKPTMKHIGNDHTKSRAVEVKCSNAECRVARTDKAFSQDHAWLTAVAIEGWNRRAALAASGGNAAPELPEPVYLGGDEAYGDVVKGYTAQMMLDYAAASAPNAALVAALKDAVSALDEVECDRFNVDMDAVSMAASAGRGALSAAGQEVGS